MLSPCWTQGSIIWSNIFVNDDLILTLLLLITPSEDPGINGFKALRDAEFTDIAAGSLDELVSLEEKDRREKLAMLW